jgi:hypothetical protein
MTPSEMMMSLRAYEEATFPEGSIFREDHTLETVTETLDRLVDSGDFIKLEGMGEPIYFQRN